MKIVWAVLKGIAVLLVLLLVAVAGVTVYASIDKADTFYVSGAEFRDYDYLSKMDKRLEDKGDYEALERAEALQGADSYSLLAGYRYLFGLYCQNAFRRERTEVRL